MEDKLKKYISDSEKIRTLVEYMNYREDRYYNVYKKLYPLQMQLFIATQTKLIMDDISELQDKILQGMEVLQ